MRCITFAARPVHGRGLQPGNAFLGAPLHFEHVRDGMDRTRGVMREVQRTPTHLFCECVVARLGKPERIHTEHIGIAFHTFVPMRQHGGDPITQTFRSAPLQIAKMSDPQRERVVRSISQQSLTGLLKDYRRKGFRIMRAAVVVGSQINPANIANPHIRAHALEGRLFRLAVTETLQAHEIRTEVLLERDAYPTVAARLKQSSDDVKRAIEDLRRSAPANGQPWRAEEKLAALAGLFALR